MQERNISLRNSNGTEVIISNYGGIIKQFEFDGTNIVLSKDKISDYKEGQAYMGALIGRVANRIGKGTFTLDGETYHIPINNGPNTNHGGLCGFDSRYWEVREVTPDTLVLGLKSQDGEEGFPGNLDVEVTYSLNDDDQLEINFRATTDKRTPVNFTSHGYFNLNGSGDIKDHLLKVNSNRITASDSDLLPTGEITDISDTPLDFTELKPLGEAISATEDINIKNARGVDHNYIFKSDQTDEVLEMAELRGDKLYLKVYSNQPGFQVYTGNYLDEKGQNGAYYNNYSGVALEAQNWPDAINHEEFPDSVLNPGEEYKVKIIYEVGKI